MRSRSVQSINLFDNISKWSMFWMVVHGTTGRDALWEVYQVGVDVSQLLDISYNLGCTSGEAE